jgi:hypothetical protein
MDASKLNGYAVFGPATDGPSAAKLLAYAVSGPSPIGSTVAKLIVYAVTNEFTSIVRPSVFAAT